MLTKEPQMGKPEVLRPVKYLLGTRQLLDSNYISGHGSFCREGFMIFIRKKKSEKKVT